MALFNKYPYTNFHELNLDWLLEEMKYLNDEWVQFEETYKGITADAESVPYGDSASVEVTGGEGVPFNFNFKIPYGKDLKLTSYLVDYGVSQSTNDIPTTWTTEIPQVPQAYYLWTRVRLNFNDNSSTTFFSLSRNGLDGTGSVVSVNNISPDTQGNINLDIPAASTTLPPMNNPSGAVGNSNEYARGDHSHPSDNTKLDKASSQGSVPDVYAVNGVNQTMIPVNDVPQGNAIARYDNNGRLKTSSVPPQNNLDVINKGYLEENYTNNEGLNNFVRKTDTASTTNLGVVKPDGTTVNVRSDGTLSAIASFSIDELWSNPDSTQEFTSQEIEITSTKQYKAYLISFRTSTSTSVVQYETTLVPILDVGRRYAQEFSGFKNSLRRFTVRANGGAVQFEGAITYDNYGNSSYVDTNNLVIPDKIYGIG